MLNQYHSKTSRYYYKYNKYYEYHTTTTIDSITADNTEYTIKDKQEVEERLEWIEDKLKECYWFDSEVSCSRKWLKYKLGKGIDGMNQISAKWAKG